METFTQTLQEKIQATKEARIKQFGSVQNAVAEELKAKKKADLQTRIDDLTKQLTDLG